MILLIGTADDPWARALLDKLPFACRRVSAKHTCATMGMPLVVGRLRGARRVILVGTAPQLLLTLLARLLGMRAIWVGNARAPRGILNAAIRIAAQLASVVVVPNRTAEAGLLRAGVPGKKISTVYPPTSAAATERKNKQLAVACDGSLGIDGGIGTLLKAVRLAQEIIGPLCVIVGGQLRDRAAIEWVARQLGVAQSVRYAPSKTFAWIEPAHLYLLPSNGAAPPLSILTAMLLGTTIVASSKCGHSEFIFKNKNAVLFEHGNAEMLSQAFITLARNAEWITQFGDNSASHARANFTPEVFKQNIQKIVS